MFKVKKISSALKRALMTDAQVKEQIEAIHNEFFTASDRLLAEAKAIANPDAAASQKANRLSRIGFANTKEVLDVRAKERESTHARHRMEAVEKYAIEYPNNKFIDEKQVEVICNKYGLVKGAVGYYKGFVPEKNLAQMESFKLKQADQPTQATPQPQFDRRLMSAWELAAMERQSLQRAMANNNRVTVEFNGRMFELGSGIPVMPVNMPTPTREPNQPTPNPVFEICAPLKDFDTNRMMVSRYNLEKVPDVPDPVVLCKVPGGYLIVTAWGDEASDEIVVNQKMN